MVLVLDTLGLLSVLLAFVAIVMIRYLLLPAAETAEATLATTSRSKQPVLTITIDTFIDSINEAFIKKLKDLSVTYRLILIASADSDGVEATITDALTAAGVLGPFIPSHRLLFHEKEEGRVSIVRQIQPYLHLESNRAVYDALLGKIKQIKLITNPSELSITQETLISSCPNS